jgi:hypothetical protein
MVECCRTATVALGTTGIGRGRSSQASANDGMNGYADDLAAVIEAARSKKGDACRSLYRRSRSRALYRSTRNEGASMPTRSGQENDTLGVIDPVRDRRPSARNISSFGQGSRARSTRCGKPVAVMHSLSLLLQRPRPKAPEHQQRGGNDRNGYAQESGSGELFLPGLPMMAC